MLRSYQDLMEEMDAQTRAKRKNRLLMFDDSAHDKLISSRLNRIQAMQDLKPIYPWTNVFLQADFRQITEAKGRQYQILDTTQKALEIDDFSDDMKKKQAALATQSYAGRGNEILDIANAYRLSDDLLNVRLLENDLIKRANNDQLTKAIKTLRPSDTTSDTYITDKQINDLTMSKKAAYLIETLEIPITKIDNAL